MMGTSFHVSWYEQSTRGRHPGGPEAWGGSPKLEMNPPPLVCRCWLSGHRVLDKRWGMGQLFTTCFRPQGRAPGGLLGYWTRARLLSR